jgi:CDGSH-type Zn-finger protein
MPIAIAKDGPYVVTGGLPLSREAIRVNAAEESADWTPLETLSPPERYFLCRCGLSANKPYCDGTHSREGFDGTETASRAPYLEQAAVLEGPAVTMLDAEALCAFARFCDRAGKVWTLVYEAASDGDRDALIAQIGQCPSGRLSARDLATGEAIEPALTPSLVLVEDPYEVSSGPIHVRGGVEIIGADGVAWETRNRVTLCRCGQSKSKPFCDGTHASIHFKDESAPTEGADV